MPTINEVRNVINSFQVNQNKIQCEITDTKSSGYIISCFSEQGTETLFNALNPHIQIAPSYNLINFYLPSKQKQQPLITADFDNNAVHLSWAGWLQLEKLYNVKTTLNEAQKYKYPVQDIQSAEYKDPINGGFYLSFANENDAQYYRQRVQQLFGTKACNYNNNYPNAVHLYWKTWLLIEQQVEQRELEKQVGDMLAGSMLLMFAGPINQTSTTNTNTNTNTYPQQNFNNNNFNSNPLGNNRFSHFNNNQNLNNNNFNNNNNGFEENNGDFENNNDGLEKYNNDLDNS